MTKRNKKLPESLSSSTLQAAGNRIHQSQPSENKSCLTAIFLYLRTLWNMNILVTIVVCLVAGIWYTGSKETPGSLHTIINHSTDSFHAFSNNFQHSSEDASEHNLLLPTVFIGVLVRNKAHTLPYFLRGLEEQDYPTDRISIRFICDNSFDGSEDFLFAWIDNVREKYHSTVVENRTSDELMFVPMWTQQHYEYVINLRQSLLTAARHSWADFYLSIDADVILMNPNTIKHLVSVSRASERVQTSADGREIIVLAPMINCTSSDYYSNFWGAMDDKGYYKRSDNYFQIQNRLALGIHEVALVHSVFLVNLRFNRSQFLTYVPPDGNYNGPVDDLIIFAKTADSNGIKLFLDNTEFFGYLPLPVDSSDLSGTGSMLEQWLRREQDLFTHLRLQAVIDLEDSKRVLPSKYLEQVAYNMLPVPSKLGFDEIYYINLDRREDRNRKMEYFLDQLGVAAIRFTAIDGKSLNAEEISRRGIKQLEGYFDPYHKRSLKMGEIGCFLSHYSLWKEMLDHGYRKILILEDDVRFAPGFVSELAKVQQEADEFATGWDLLYIGRKRMSSKERRVPGSSRLAYPDYTYWTLGYILKLSGAKKLLAQNPLQKMVAVDEYLPIMFNRHPKKDWLESFEPRNLIALSAEPLLLEPQRYTGETFYVSDTEDSPILNNSSQ